MPVYIYNGCDCGEQEITQKINDGHLRKCPHCGGKIERVPARCSFILEGNGWCRDGYSS